ncbi:hypothetical protein HOH51_00750 [bacterium]|jgi:putative sigma-54 modulation protein|nr:hypothetical protein [bacterium]
MNINVHKNFDVANADLEFLKSRILDLEKICGKISDESVLVQLHILKLDGINHKDKIELKVSMHIPKVSFQAHTMCYKTSEGIDAIIAKLKRQIEKYKTRMHIQDKADSKLDFRDKFDFVELVDNAELGSIKDEAAAEVQLDMITKKTLFSDLTPMTQDQALEQIKALALEFMVFVNLETDRYNIIYKREQNASYAIIELETQNGILDL